jgi:hypothetical protein
VRLLILYRLNVEFERFRVVLVREFVLFRNGWLGSGLISGVRGVVFCGGGNSVNCGFRIHDRGGGGGGGVGSVLAEV